MPIEFGSGTLSMGDLELQCTGGYVPAMTQARWHKKARIRKKWLKRYGMKPDTVKVEYDAKSIQMDGCVFAFETNEIRHILRPDQKRRGIKIEF